MSILLLMNGSNNFVKCSCPKKSPVYLEQKCALCNETTSVCEDFASEDNKVSLKKLILQFLKKVNLKGVNSQTCFEECTHCKHICSKRQGIAKVLANILKKACINKEEEESIREIILKLLDPSNCEKNPCQAHCDPQVQEILKAILRRAAGCSCKECPLNCVMNLPRSDGDNYKYWFRTTKEGVRKEYTNTYTSRPKLCETNPECCQEEKKETREVCSCRDTLNKRKGKSREIYRRDLQKCNKCKQCQRPERLICPRYVTEGCPMRHKDDSFTLCADCKECYILLKRCNNNNAVMFCESCNALNSPFVQFTRNGYPFKQLPERQNGIKIRTKFLQINDFRLNEAEQKKVFNPFQPKCNIPRKSRSRRKGRAT